jgi:hypothetical protein
MENEMESIARELKLLASRQQLSATELERAKALMVKLKMMGMTNAEINELVGDRWSESTIKGYTRGVPAIPSPPWEAVVVLFSQLLSKGLTIEDVEETVRLKKELERQKTSITELASFVGELDSQGIDAARFVNLYWDWVGAGLKAPDVTAVLKLKGELEGMGLSLDSLVKVAELAGKFGNADGVLEAVAKYGSIVEMERQKANMQAEMEREKADTQMEMERERTEHEAKMEEEKSAAREHLDKLGMEIAAKEQTLQGLQAGINEANEALTKYQSLVNRGFDLPLLQQVTEVAEKYDSPSGLLEAVNLFNGLTDIRARCDDANRDLENKHSALKSLEDNYSHLRSAIELCKKLMDDYGLNMDGISTILSTAEKYGDAVEVLKAIEACGRLMAIEEEVRRQKLKVAETQAKIKTLQKAEAEAKAKIEAKIETLQKAEAEAKAKIEAAFDLIEALNSKALEVGKVIGADEERMRRSRRFSKILSLLEEPTKAGYEESVPHVLALTNVIYTFVCAHSGKFIKHFTITQALEYLMEDLGGWHR